MRLLQAPDTEAVHLALSFLEMVLHRYPGKGGVKLVEEANGIEMLETLQNLYPKASGIFLGEEGSEISW